MSQVRVEKKGAITTVILSRPERKNAVDRPTAEALANAFEEFEKDKEAKVAVLWGEGESFCAGADLKAFAARDSNPSLSNSLSSVMSDRAPMGVSRFLLSKPVIAAISGHAVAGGLELALWCDLRIAENDTILGVFCRRWGVPLIDGGTVRLPRLIGMSHALDLILTGRAVGAQEALSIGLVNRVVPKGQARKEAERLALVISEFPQDCMKNDRLSVYEQHSHPLTKALEIEFEYGKQSLASSEINSSVSRFVQGAGRHGRFDSKL